MKTDLEQYPTPVGFRLARELSESEMEQVAGGTANQKYKCNTMTGGGSSKGWHVEYTWDY